MKDAAAQPASRPPGRPRDPALDEAILEATIRLLAEDGFARVSIEAVAREAGVGKTTVYRRWPSKTALVVDALQAHAPQTTVPAEGTVRERLVWVVQAFITQLRSGHSARLLAGLVAEIPRDPELAAAIRAAFIANPRRQRVFDLLREGIEAGELREELDLELAADQLVGPILIRLLLTGGTISPRLAPAIVDSFFDGWGPGS